MPDDDICLASTGAWMEVGVGTGVVWLVEAGVVVLLGLGLG